MFSSSEQCEHVVERVDEALRVGERETHGRLEFEDVLVRAVAAHDDAVRRLPESAKRAIESNRLNAAAQMSADSRGSMQNKI